VSSSPPATDLARYRAELRAWLDAHHDEVALGSEPPATLDDRIAQMQHAKKVLFDAGWM
jgi:hypothetical protein